MGMLGDVRDIDPSHNREDSVKTTVRSAFIHIIVRLSNSILQRQMMLTRVPLSAFSQKQVFFLLRKEIFEDYQLDAFHTFLRRCMDLGFGFLKNPK